jgi:hypothetical protein
VCYVCLDGDAHEPARDLARSLSGLFEVRVVYLSTKDDPGSLTPWRLKRHFDVASPVNDQVF